MLLPYIEQQNALNEDPDIALNWSDPRFGTPQSQRLTIFKTLTCPLQVNLISANYQWAGSSYWGNGGPTSDSSGDYGGLFFMGSKLRIRDIRDGTSTTLMFGEQYASDPNWNKGCDPAGQVAGTAGAQTPTPGGLLGGCNLDLILAWFGYGDQNLSSLMPINFRCSSNPSDCGMDGATNWFIRSRTYGSGHTGGVNMAFADGHVQFMGDVERLSSPHRFRLNSSVALGSLAAKQLGCVNYWPA